MKKVLTLFLLLCLLPSTGVRAQEDDKNAELVIYERFIDAKNYEALPNYSIWKYNDAYAKALQSSLFLEKNTLVTSNMTISNGNGLKTDMSGFTDYQKQFYRDNLNELAFFNLYDKNNQIVIYAYKNQIKSFRYLTDTIVQIELSGYHLIWANDVTGYRGNEYRLTIHLDQIASEGERGWLLVSDDDGYIYKYSPYQTYSIN